MTGRTYLYFHFRNRRPRGKRKPASTAYFAFHVFRMYSFSHFIFFFSSSVTNRQFYHFSGVMSIEYKPVQVQVPGAGEKNFGGLRWHHLHLHQAPAPSYTCTLLNKKGFYLLTLDDFFFIVYLLWIKNFALNKSFSNYTRNWS